MNEEPATEKQVKFMRNLNIEVPNGITKMEARLAIDRVLNKAQDSDMQKPEVVRPGKLDTAGKVLHNMNNGSMYASYAKDVWSVLMANAPNKTEINPEGLMIMAIELVKQAKEAFE